MPKTILIVDDSPTVRQQVGIALGQAGFHVVEAADGVEGAEQAKRRSDLALIISDVNMPRMDGIEMLERINADAKGARPPVLMLTTERQPRLLERAQGLGAVGWIVKPFKAEALVATAKKITAGP
jgi:two-component system chemotaxis response regulator CheY